MKKWSYYVERVELIERLSPKRQAKEIESFQNRLNEIGQEGWEMIGFESVPLMGGITGQLKGYAYLTFWKKPAEPDLAS